MLKKKIKTTMQTIKIRDIVETYEDLTHNQRERVIVIATSQIEEFGLHTFSQAYSHIGKLVEIFQQPWLERVALRFDAPPREGNKGKLIDSFSYGQNIYETEDLFNGVSLDTIVQISDRFLDRKEIDLIHKLLENSQSNEKVLLTHDEIVGEIPKIRKRLEVLVKLLREDSRFSQPERRIAYVNLGPDNPWIQWKRRKYNGKPIDFFRRHIDVYGRFVEEGRKALQRFDSGLFGALRDNTIEIDERIIRQVELAIPKLKPRGNRGHNENIVKQIVLSYGCFDGNVTRASDALPYSRATIAKYWKTAELKIRSHRNGDFVSKINSREAQQIIEAHNLYGGSAYQAARYLPYHKSTIVRYWKQAGLPILKHKRRRVNYGSSPNKGYS